MIFSVYILSVMCSSCEKTLLQDELGVNVQLVNKVCYVGLIGDTDAPSDQDVKWNQFKTAYDEGSCCYFV